jgi:LysM repeat protein
MRTPIQVLLTTIAVLAVPATASADFGHVVAAGESLSSVAAADGLSVAQLAAANGLSPTANLIAGSTIQIPPPSGVGSGAGQGTESSDGDAGGPTPAAAGGPTPTATGGPTPAATAPAARSYVVQPGDTLSAIAAANGVSVGQLAAANGLDPNGVLLSGSTLDLAGGSQAMPAAGASQSVSAPLAGAYVVQPGDTLSAIAAANGMSVGQLAAANGLDPNGVLLSGSTLNLGGGSGASTGQPETTGVPGTGAQPTPQMVSAQDVAQIAAANGVPASLAEAIGYQESGFNNNLVSPTGAAGVMQIEPATWNYIQRDLAGPPPLAPNSAADNIRAGSLLLHSLLAQTGGNASLAAAGYYQGLPSVEQNGIYPSTQQYVNDVMALQQQFGGS